MAMVGCGRIYPNSSQDSQPNFFMKVEKEEFFFFLNNWKSKKMKRIGLAIKNK